MENYIKQERRKFSTPGILAILGALFSVSPSTEASAKNTDTKPSVSIEQVIQNFEKKRAVSPYTLETEKGRKIVLKHFSTADFEKLSEADPIKKFINFVFLDHEEIDKMDEESKNIYYSIWNLYRESSPGYGVNDVYKELKSEEEDLINRYNMVIKELKAADLNDNKRRAKLNIEHSSLKEQILEVKKKLSKQRELLSGSFFDERIAIMQTVLVRTRDGLSGNSEFKKTIWENILKKAQYSWTGENKFPLVKDIASSKGDKAEKVEEINFKALLSIAEIYENYVSGKTVEEAIELIATKLEERIYGGNVTPEIKATLRNLRYSQATSLFNGAELSEQARKIASSKTEKDLENVIQKTMRAEDGIIVTFGHIISTRRSWEEK